MRKNLFTAFASLFVCANTALGASVPVVSPSFETPVVPDTVPALPFFEGWQHTPKPDWYVEDPNDPTTQWANFAGVFPNTPAGSAGHIDNMDQKQAAYIFAVPSDGIFQDLAAKFEVAQRYTLTVGLVQSATFGPNPGSTLALNLYYRDLSSNIVTVASQTVTFNSTNFPTNNHFVDFTLHSSAVKSSDAWAGKNIGLMIVSTAAPENSGGIWDLDNVRLTAEAVPNGSFESPVVPNTVPALPFFEAWQHTPKPDWYVEDPNDPTTQWANFAGVFPNPAPGTSGHIENMDQNQGAYLFAVPSNGIFQELPATYEAGVSYKLSAGFVGSATFAPADGSIIQLSLYYRDGTNLVTVASRSITYNSTTFPSLTNFVDFTLNAPFVEQTNAWVGKQIGVAITSTVAQAGGIWDIDNVRLTANPLRLQIAFNGPKVELTWPTTAGVTYDVEVSGDLINWINYSGPLTGTGSPITMNISYLSQRGGFFRLKLLSNP
jgi:hypothetical protein